MNIAIFMNQTTSQPLGLLQEAIKRLDSRVGRGASPVVSAQAMLRGLIGGPPMPTRAACRASWRGPSRPVPPAEPVASWVAICPGNHESAGKRKSGKTRKGNRWLRAALVEAAWAAAHSQGTYLAALYSRLFPRKAEKRASGRCLPDAKDESALSRAGPGLLRPPPP